MPDAIEKFVDAKLEEELARMKAALEFVAGHLTTEEGDRDATEEDMGLDASEVIEMAHDNIIWRARRALGRNT